MSLKDEPVGYLFWEQILTGKMTYATVDKFKGIRFEIRPKESPHNVPHCHASYQGSEVSVSLIDFSILDGNIPLKQQRQASDWIKNNIGVLKKYWNDFHSEIVA